MQGMKVIVVSVLGLALVAALTGTTGANPSKAPWKIIVGSDREGKDVDIYSMKADGTNVRRLTNNPMADFPGVWSPNGRRVLFSSSRSPKGDVWVMNADGSRQRNLTRSPAFECCGSWSPDGRKVLFVTDRDGNNEIYSMNADGSGQQIVSASPSSDEIPAALSPDGQSIAFATDRDGNWEVYVMNADGSEPRNITRTPGSDGRWNGFLWSPDSRKLVLASTRDTRDDDNPELYLMKADGTAVRRLTRTPGIESPLSWSPDAQKIAFQRDPSTPRWAFFTMNADGSGVRKVTWSLPARKG